MNTNKMFQEEPDLETIRSWIELSKDFAQYKYEDIQNKLQGDFIRVYKTLEKSDISKIIKEIVKPIEKKMRINLDVLYKAIKHEVFIVKLKVNDSNIAVIGLKGTEHIDYAIKDLIVQHPSAIDSRMHAGFSIIANEILEKAEHTGEDKQLLKRQLTHIYENYDEVYLVGHSLGGPVAAYFGNWLIEKRKSRTSNKFKRIKSFGIGSPPFLFTKDNTHPKLLKYALENHTVFAHVDDPVFYAQSPWSDTTLFHHGTNFVLFPKENVIRFIRKNSGIPAQLAKKSPSVVDKLMTHDIGNYLSLFTKTDDITFEEIIADSQIASSSEIMIVAARQSSQLVGQLICESGSEALTSMVMKLAEVCKKEWETKILRQVNEIRKEIDKAIVSNAKDKVAILKSQLEMVNLDELSESAITQVKEVQRCVDEIDLDKVFKQAEKVTQEIQKQSSKVIQEKEKQIKVCAKEAKKIKKEVKCKAEKEIDKIAKKLKLW